MDNSKKTKNMQRTCSDAEFVDGLDTCVGKNEHAWIIGSRDVAKEIFVRNNSSRRSRKSHSYPPCRSTAKSDLTIGSSHLYCTTPNIVQADSKPIELAHTDDKSQLSRIAENYKNIVQEFAKIIDKEPVDCIVTGSGEMNVKDTSK